MGLPKIDELWKYLEKWHLWIGIVFLFIPGVLYQIQIKGTEYFSLFSGSLVIVFLILSLYYSIPYIVMGLFLFMIAEPGKDVGEENFFSFSILGILSYATVFFIHPFISQNIPFYVLTGGFIIILFVVAIVINIIHEIIERRKKKKK